MEDKITIRCEETIRKLLSDANKLNDLRKEDLTSLAKSSIMAGTGDTSFKVSQTELAKTTFALQQHANGGLANIINSLLQHTNNNLHKILWLIAQKAQETNMIRNIGTKKSVYEVYSSPKDNPQTVARLLGEVVSDFLVGLSKNKSNLIVTDLVSSMIAHFDNLEYNPLDSSQTLLKILDFLSSPICYTNEECEDSNNKKHLSKKDNNEANRVPNM